MNDIQVAYWAVGVVLLTLFGVWLLFMAIRIGLWLSDKFRAGRERRKLRQMVCGTWAYAVGEAWVDAWRFAREWEKVQKEVGELFKTVKDGRIRFPQYTYSLFWDGKKLDTMGDVTIECPVFRYGERVETGDEHDAGPDYGGVWANRRPCGAIQRNCDCLYWTPKPRFGDKCPNCGMAWISEYEWNKNGQKRRD